jgi:hypothetical protein
VWVLDPVDGLIVLVAEDDVLLVDNVAVGPSARGEGWAVGCWPSRKNRRGRSVWPRCGITPTRR